jgi:hypothetical protein
MSSGKVISALFVVALALSGCAGGTPEAGSAANARMTPAEARDFIVKAQAERGLKPTEADRVTSIEQVFEVIEGDQLPRFEEASRLVAGKPGIDAQTLYVTIELLWSDGYSTIARLVEELAERDSVEVERLEALKKSGRELGEADAKALEQAQHDVEFELKARDALDVLAVDHLRGTVTQVNELLRLYPQDPRAVRVAALYYLLSGDWKHFDDAMAPLKGTESQDPGLQYLRAMEAWKRFAIKKEANAFLREALRLNPKLVRAQAKLVLTEDSIEATHAELEKLIALAPRHPIVNLAGPSIKSEYETALAVQRARPGAAPTAP